MKSYQCVVFYKWVKANDRRTVTDKQQKHLKNLLPALSNTYVFLWFEPETLSNNNNNLFIHLIIIIIIIIISKIIIIGYE